MPDNFFGFTTKSFEQFTQAVAIHTIGPGVTIFGSGPDGGREATFEGSINYPFEGSSWSGYGIIQAKYKEKTEGTEIDQKWALSQLQEELEKFLISKRRRKKPEYFIFATNVVLTPFAESGGKDKAKELIESYYTKLPLKGYGIWDQDQISTFLDVYEDLRKRFFIQLTSGDILAKLASVVEKSEPDFLAIATSFLDRQLRDDADARLDQAGQRVDQRTALARVFVDLPVAEAPREEAPDEETPNELTRGFLHKLIEEGGKKLDPQSLRSFERERALENPLRHTETNRWVLIGGPGSGKSTLSQFLAQVHRASILDRREPYITSESRTIIAQIRELCVSDNIPWPQAPRFPFRVDLSAFARSLASENTSEKASSLIEYLTQKLRGSRNLKVEDVLKWLTQYPSLLILDGLDEVPASSNRNAVCNAIQDFFSEVAQNNIDILTLATTRPSGYNEEFGKESFEYRYLPPLSIKRSLLYSHRFAVARFGSNSSRVDEMAQRLLEASRDSLTARLMRTPLQVTFMATLVAAGGRPPRDRWKLFRDYYDTIYKREQQKADGDLRAVLDSHDTLIHRVHHDVGFILQVHGENAGATDAMMPLKAFSQLVESYLLEEGWENPDLRHIADRVSDEARTRLVFLTSRIADNISFDVRSLQEHMAGECIMTGSESHLHERLSAIAPLSYWRNVFLFAAGQCFSAPQLKHLRSIIHQVCEEINDTENDPLLGFTLSGSRLALDLLEDGTVTNTPNFARLLTRLALQLLQSSKSALRYGSDPGLYSRLAGVYDPKLDGIYREVLDLNFSSKEAPSAQAWSILIELIERNVGWALSLADEHWPSEDSQQIAALDSMSSTHFSSPWLIRRLTEVVPKARAMTFSFHNIKSQFVEIPKWLTAALSVYYKSRPVEKAILHLPSLDQKIISLAFDPVFSDSDPLVEESFELKNMPNPSPGWLPTIARTIFLESPTKETLATLLQNFKNNFPSLPTMDIDDLPWPLKACLSFVKNESDLDHLIEQASNGTLGDTEDWRTAEHRWMQEGITLEDFHASDKLPFDKTVSTHGYPCSISVNWNNSELPRHQITSTLIELFQSNLGANQQSTLKLLILSNLAYRRILDEDLHPILPIDLWRKLCNLNKSLNFNLRALCAFQWPEKMDADWVEFFNLLGKAENNSNVYRGSHQPLFPTILPEQLTAAYIVNPELTGILRVLSWFVLSGYQVSVPYRLLDPDRFADARMQMSAILIHMAQGSIQNVDEMVNKLITIERANPKLGAIHYLLQTVPLSMADRKTIEALVVKLRKRLTDHDGRLISHCDRIMIFLLGRRNSDLKNRTVAETLKLPWFDLE